MNGASLKFTNPALVQQYANSIKGLNLQQAQLALSTKILSDNQKEQILVQAGLKASEDAIQAELLETTLKQAGVSAEKRKAILDTLGLMNAEGTEVLAQKTCTKADLEAVLAQKLKNAEDTDGIIKALGLAGANTTTTASFGLLTKGIWANIKAMVAWMVSNPLGWIILLGGTIAATVGLVDLFTTSVEEHREKLESLKSEYSDVKSELDGLKGELDGTQSRINELENKGKLTFTEAEELNNLRKQNNELQRSIDLLELQNKTKKKELNDQFVETMNSDIEQELYTRNENDEVVQYMPMSGQTATDDNEADYITQRFKDLEKLRGELSSASTEAEKERIKRQIKGIEDYFIQKNKDFTETAEGIDYIQNPTTKDDEKVNEWLDYINDFQDQMAIAMGGENAKENAFNRLVDNWKFDELLNPLQKLGKEGKVTAEMLNDPKYDAFIQKLIDIEFISDDTEGSLRFVASAFNGTMQSAQKYVTSLKGNEINNFIKNLNNEAKALGTTESELAKLTAAHVIFNNTGLSTEQQQQALQMLAAKIATTSAEMKYLLQLFNYASGNFDAAGASTMTEQERRARTVRSKQYLKDKYGIDLSPIKIPEKEDTPPYTPSGGDDKGSSKDNTPDYEDPTDAIINRINLRAKELEQQEESIQNAIEIAELENDYKKQISLTNDKLNTQKQKVDALKIANNELHQMAENLRNSTPQWNEESWFNSQGQATEAYNTLYNNSSKEEQEKLKDQFEKISKIKKAWVENDEKRLEITKEILHTEEELVNLDFENSQEWIDERNRLNDWQLFDDNEIAAWERVIKRLKEDYKDCAGAAEKIKEAEQNLFEARKEQFDKANDFANTYLESKKTLLQAHFDVENSIAEAQHEINKELETSMAMYEYLDEDTRKLLFNQEDYNTLAEELYGIQDKADKLKGQYERDLDKATLETVEQITSNYEMQYETLMKSYEIAKADLEIAKKKQKLNNVLNERNVRMFINGSWQWVANTEDVANAKAELADAEYAKRVEESGLAQQESINNLTKQQDELSVVIKKFENGVIDLDEAIILAKDAIGSLPSAIEDLLDSVSSSKGGVSSASSSEKKSKSGKKISSYNGGFVDSLGSDVEKATARLPAGITTTVHIKNGKTQETGLPAGTIVSTSGGDYRITGGKGGADGYTSVKVEKKHADGTRCTPGGLTLMGEEGFEAYISSNGHLIPINQPTIGNIGAGGIVFNQEQMANLRSMWDLSNLKLNHSLPNVTEIAQSISTIDNSIHINGMTISEQGNEDWISGLRRYVYTHKGSM